MIPTIVIVDPNVTHAGDVDTCKTRMAELIPEWENTLKKASEEKLEDLRIPGLTLSATNSDNFHVIGTLLRNINVFLHTHEFPKTVTIACADDPTATMYRQIYNFYIAGSKPERLQDKNWD